MDLAREATSAKVLATQEMGKRVREAMLAMREAPRGA